MSQIPSIWHAKFYLDGHTLWLSPPALDFFAGSYRGTAWWFTPAFELLAYLGIDLSSYSTQFGTDWLITNVLWAAPYLIAMLFLARRLDYPLDPSGIFTLFCALTLYAPFYASINKDIIPALFCFSCIFLLAKGRQRCALAAFIVLAVAYGLTIRTYFLIFSVLLLATHLISRNRKYLPVAFVAGSVAVYLAFPLIPRALIDIGRSEYLEGVSATRISYFFDDYSALGFTLNRLSSIVRISFPLELIVKSPAYLPFVVFRCYISILTLRLMGRESSNDIRLAAGIVFSFTLTQAIFEPDFGSSFRHFMMVMPAVIYLQTGRAQLSRLLRAPRLVLR